MAKQYPNISTLMQYCTKKGLAKDKNKKIFLNISKVLIAAASALMLFCAVIYIAVVFFFTDINANIYLLLMVIMSPFVACS